MPTRSHIFAAQSDPSRNPQFGRRWSPAAWEAIDLAAHSRRTARQGDATLAREFAQGALRLRVVDARR